MLTHSNDIDDLIISFLKAKQVVSLRRINKTFKDFIDTRYIKELKIYYNYFYPKIIRDQDKESLKFPKSYNLTIIKIIINSTRIYYSYKVSIQRFCPIKDRIYNTKNYKNWLYLLKEGNIETIQYLWDEGIFDRNYKPTLLNNVIKSNNLSFIRYFIKRYNISTKLFSHAYKEAVFTNCVQIIEYFQPYLNIKDINVNKLILEGLQRYKYESVYYLVKLHNLDLEFIHKIINKCIYHINLFKFIINKYIVPQKDSFSINTLLNNLIENNLLELIQWLHENNIIAFNNDTLLYAICKSNLDVVKYIHTNVENLNMNYNDNIIFKSLSHNIIKYNMFHNKIAYYILSNIDLSNTQFKIIYDILQNVDEYTAQQIINLLISNGKIF